MSKKIIPFFVGILFFSSFQLAQASLIIDEVMYDLTGSDTTSGKSREWVEVYNPDTSDVAIDASKWRIYDGSNHTINGEVNFSIPAGAYVVFAGDKDVFLADNSGFSGTVYDTGITSLNNTGATLKILDQDGNAVDSFTYTSAQGGAGDGNSLQLINSSWTGTTPTPGAANQVSSTPPAPSATSAPVATGSLVINSSSGNSSSTQNTNITETKSQKVEEAKIKAQISAKAISFVGLPVIFQAKAFGYNKEELHYGKFFWNFGDGDSKEVSLNGASNAGAIEHTYFYPGEYNVNLEYYLNSYSDFVEAFDKITIKVVGTDVVISKVGDEKDFFVEVSNNTAYDADISNWILKSSTKRFVFPRDTIISSKKKMIVSSNLTGFTFQDKSSLKLMTPQGRTIFDYGVPVSPAVSMKPAPVKPAKIVVKNKASTTLVKKEDTTAKSADVSIKNEIKVETPPTELPITSLPAAALESDVAKTDSNNSGSSYLPIIFSFIFIGASAGAVYFIRRKKVIPKVGNDFKILDESR